MEQPQNIGENLENPPADEAWRRFTLLDLLILFTGHEVGLAVMKWCGALDARFGEKLAGVHLLFWVFLLFGGLFSMPVVLGVQFYSRHRPKRLTVGERLAVFNHLIWAATSLCLLSGFDPPRGLQIAINCATFFYVCICGIGSIAFVVKLFSSKRNVPCRWLDLYGYFQCVITLGVVFSVILLLMFAYGEMP